MKKLLCVCLILMLLLPALPAFAAGDYSDVPAGSWYETYVTDLSMTGVIGGYPDGTFRPDAQVTYGQALKLILLAAGYPVAAPLASHWAGGYLALAKLNGLVSTSFDPDLERPITRLEVAELAAAALGLGYANIATPFVDCDRNEVLALYKVGILTGTEQDGQTFFFGEQSLLRAQISAIIWRIERYRAGQLMAPELPPAEIAPPVAEQPPVTPPFEAEPPKTITYDTYTVNVLEDVPVFAYDPTSFSMQDGRMTCSDPKVKLVHGIDVSAHQEEIDWQAIKADGIEFAILRAAYRGYTVGSLNQDKYFEQNIRGALQAGLQVGVYVFSQAITVQEAIEEAEFVLQLLEPYSITGPVVFDWEVIGKKEARTYGLDTDTLCAAANAFCSRVKQEGYTPMVYFNPYCGYVKYDLSRILDYDFWFAQYKEQPDFYYNFQMWQYTSSGKVDGIKGNVDLNVYLLPNN